MPSWDPQQYARFGDERLRPGLELMARIPDRPAKRVVDLGCGTGELTARLAERFPEAEVIGLDSSPAMLERATPHPRIRYVQADITSWQPEHQPDLIYTNATLHWLPDHAALFPKLMNTVSAGGVFACQIPNNYMEPSHRLMRALATSERWSERLAEARALAPVARPDAYFAWLAAAARSIDLWETRYWHVLAGENAVVEWVKGTGLRPFLDRLEGDERQAFLADYAETLREPYPRRADGTTLYPFPRLFIVAERA